MREQLEKSLYYLSISELKTLCSRLGVMPAKLKKELIDQIIAAVEGKKLSRPARTSVSVAKRKAVVIAPDALMIKGVYKNDAANRQFFKSMIGDHFHFTVFGIDWLHAQWAKGINPSYNDFIAQWKDAYAARKITKSAPKKEWQYIRFVQSYIQNHESSSKEIIQAWREEKKKHQLFVEDFFKNRFKT